MEQSGSVWVHTELSCLCMGKDFGKSKDGQPRIAAALGCGSNLI